jgi:hypothetical protein
MKTTACDVYRVCMVEFVLHDGSKVGGWWGKYSTLFGQVGQEFGG